MSKKVLAVLLMAVVALFALSACKAGNQTTTQKAQSDSSASADAGNTEKKQKESAADKEAAEKSGTTKSGNSDSKADSGSNSQAAAGDNSGAKSETATKKGEKTTAKKAEKSAAKKKTSTTDGWQRTKDGSVVKGEVTADVVNYGKTTVDEGEQLIKELVKAGLSKTKKLSSEKGERVVTYKYSGKRIGNDDVEYIKFQFIVENGRGYLVTVIAQNQSDMDTDISYLTKNLAKFAK